MVHAVGARSHRLYSRSFGTSHCHGGIPRCHSRLDRVTRVPLLRSCGRMQSEDSSESLQTANVNQEDCMPLYLAMASFFLTALPASASSIDVNTVIPGLVGDSPFREGLISGFFLIFFSEIGDKTFFIALLLALQRPKSAVFAGTFGALAVMTVISVGLGRVLHEIDELFPDIGIPLDDVLAVALLVFFGIQTLASASEADETAEEEKEEAQEVVDGLNADSQVIGLVLSTFVLVFAAEWGDKSFLATIALAAASDPVGVIGGAVTGHGVATAIAVVGGSFLGKYLSEKTVQYIGGTLFLVFAAATLLDIYRGV